MSDALGPRTFGDKEELVFLGKEIHERRDYSESIAEKIDAEVSKIITAGYKKAKTIIIKHKAKLDSIVQALLEKETLEREQFEAIVGKPEMPKAVLD